MTAADAAELCRRERIALLVWLEPGAARLSDWSGQLRAGLTGDPMAVHRAGVSSTDPGMLLAAGLTALAAGCPRHAVEPLSKVVDHSASSAALVASARLGLAGAALLAGELPADIDVAAEQLEVLGLGGLTRVASVLRPFAAGGDVRAEAAAVEAACRRVGDEWGVAAASFLLGWGLMARHDPAGAVAAFCATATIQAAAGMSDMHNCNVPPIPPPIHGVGVVTDGSKTVLINGMPACRLGDTITEAFGPPNKIMMGQPNVIIFGG